MIRMIRKIENIIAPMSIHECDTMLTVETYFVILSVRRTHKISNVITTIK